MTAVFDPDAGVLRLGAAELDLLTKLAADPTSKALIDHAVAPPLAALRASGVLSNRGIHPDVLPLAQALAGATTALEVLAEDHGVQRQLRAWVSPALAVIAVAPAQDPGAFDLLADAPVMLPAVLGELLGLGPVPEPTVRGQRTVDRMAFERLLSASAGVTVEEVAERLGIPVSDPWIGALHAGLRGSALRWTLAARAADEPAMRSITVLDAGRSGLWLSAPSGPDVALAAVTAAEIHARIASLADG